jgi:hypothetical protein
VKYHVKILSLVGLIAIYCSAIGAVNNSLVYSDISINKTSSQEKVISFLSEKLFLHTSSDSSLKDYNNLPGPDFKKQLTGLFAIINATEHLIGSEFSQYTTFTRSILVNHRNTDIIFPFHYFW